jgi:hypothetical protein
MIMEPRGNIEELGKPEGTWGTPAQSHLVHHEFQINSPGTETDVS